MQFQKGTRYLLRIINTAFDSTFIFSIDNHPLEVIASDFVPIKPYITDYLHVGIGQRYHVIVDATDPLHTGGNYWIRTYKADCFRFNNSDPTSHIQGYERSGFVQYGSSMTPPSTTQSPPDFTCADEPYASFTPIVSWTVSKTPKNDPAGSIGENMTVQLGNGGTLYPLAFASVGGEQFNPLGIDYGNPTFLNLNNTGEWNPLWVVFPEDFTATDWVSLFDWQFATYVL